MARPYVPNKNNAPNPFSALVDSIVGDSSDEGSHDRNFSHGFHNRINDSENSNRASNIINGFDRQPQENLNMFKNSHATQPQTTSLKNMSNTTNDSRIMSVFTDNSLPSLLPDKSNQLEKSPNHASNNTQTSPEEPTVSTIPSSIPSRPPPVLEGENALESPYTFWFSQRGRGAKSKTTAGDFEQNIKYIVSVSSVEQFWRAYSYMVQPHELVGRCDVHLFRFGIRPMWEDEANKHGGKWTVRLRKGVATRCWENLILAMLGEQFMAGEEICGAVISVRYHTEDIVNIWNRTASNQAAIIQIRDILKRVLNLPSNTIMEYKEHHDSMKGASTRTTPGKQEPTRSMPKENGN